jgi:hypothetical protein
VQVSEHEYYVTFDAYKLRTLHNKAITYSLNNGFEFMTVHTPKKLWGSSPSLELCPRTFSSASVFWFYNFNLPNEFSMVNYYSNKYVKYNDKCYTIEQGDIVFQRKEGSKEWQPLVVHTQFKHHIDREQTKQLKESISPFLSYFDVMCDIVDAKHDYGNLISGVLSKDYTVAVTPKMARDLFKPSDSIPDEWLLLVERYKSKLNYSKKLDDGNWHNKVWSEDLPKALLSDLYGVAKPCKAIEVPLGEVAIDRYKKWYR